MSSGKTIAWPENVQIIVFELCAELAPTVSLLEIRKWEQIWFFFYSMYPVPRTTPSIQDTALECLWVYKWIRNQIYKDRRSFSKNKIISIYISPDCLIKYHRMGGLNNRNLFSESLRSSWHNCLVLVRPFFLARRWLFSHCVPVCSFLSLFFIIKSHQSHQSRTLPL